MALRLLRHHGITARLTRAARAQRTRRGAETRRPARAGQIRRADQRCRHAGDFRSRRARRRGGEGRGLSGRSRCPGPNAAICALSAAGIAAPHFLFYGFLPQQASARKRELDALKALPYLMRVSTKRRTASSPASPTWRSCSASARITIARELTKLFETIHTCRLSEAEEWFAADANQLKGEFVLLVEGAPAAATADPAAARHVLEVLMRELSLKQAVNLQSPSRARARTTCTNWRSSLTGRAEFYELEVSA